MFLSFLPRSSERRQWFTISFSYFPFSQPGFADSGRSVFLVFISSAFLVPRTPLCLSLVFNFPTFVCCSSTPSYWELCPSLNFLGRPF